MNTLKLDDIIIEFDKNKTSKFYQQQPNFICMCDDCINYVNHLSSVHELLENLDGELGIDLSKAVGQGMDELQPHDYDDHQMYLVPYYIVGKCRIRDEELKKQYTGPILESTKRVEHKFASGLNIVIINTTGDIQIDDVDHVLTIWLEVRTNLFKKGLTSQSRLS